jgi:hypothetical protein
MKVNAKKLRKTGSPCLVFISPGSFGNPTSQATQGGKARYGEMDKSNLGICKSPMFTKIAWGEVGLLDSHATVVQRPMPAIRKEGKQGQCLAWPSESRCNLTLSGAGVIQSERFSVRTKAQRSRIRSLRGNSHGLLDGNMRLKMSNPWPFVDLVPHIDHLKALWNCPILDLVPHFDHFKALKSLLARTRRKKMFWIGLCASKVVLVGELGSQGLGPAQGRCDDHELVHSEKLDYRQFPWEEVLSKIAFCFSKECHWNSVSLRKGDGRKTLTLCEKLGCEIRWEDLGGKSWVLNSIFLRYPDFKLKSLSLDVMSSSWTILLLIF